MTGLEISHISYSDGSRKARDDVRRPTPKTDTFRYIADDGICLDPAFSGRT
ncbi:hypothetical protein QN219_21075 [Sinorhizobium sp. 7-81]|uniref:hypothetical protein n=1 Tax=Sinorhizobium sp. 8-89 TaxID=3049089 RepID=UPI0024C36402|nr:hypothetical protein [Sinorhizobium sp. 8-89]MDK1492522.1 hypothetical protein [Sinorhizobium sp. 8-89]